MLKNLSKIQQVSTCFSFHKASFWIETEAFRTFPANLRATAFSIEDKVPLRTVKTVVALHQQLVECEVVTVWVWAMNLHKNFVTIFFEDWGKREEIIFCFLISQMFLASFGSEITHSQVKPLTLHFGTCDPWQHLVYPLPGDIFGCGNK